MRGLLILTAAYGQLLSPSALAQSAAPPFARAVDSTVDSVMRIRDIPGSAVVIVRGDAVVFERGYGVESRERDDLVTPDTRFQIGSLIKPFTATAIMMLVGDGMLALDDRVSVYLPWLPVAYDSITIRELLTHTSGVARDLRTSNTDDMSVEQFLQRLASAPASFSRGTRFEYANSGFILLGMIVDAVAGESYEVFLERRLIGPARLTNTRYLGGFLEGRGIARGYEPIEGTQQPATYFAGGYAAGGLSSSASDVARFVFALDRGTLVPRATYMEMTTPARLANGRQIIAFGDSTRSYGLGWRSRATAANASSRMGVPSPDFPRS